MYGSDPVAGSKFLPNLGLLFGAPIQQTEPAGLVIISMWSNGRSEACARHGSITTSHLR
jgi:hypothetical protein